MHHRIVSDDSVTDLYNNLYKVAPTSVQFKYISIEDDDVSGKIYSLPDIANDVLEKFSDNTTDEKFHTSCKVYQQHQGTPMKWNRGGGGNPTMIDSLKSP